MSLRPRLVTLASGAAAALLAVVFFRRRRSKADSQQPATDGFHCIGNVSDLTAGPESVDVWKALEFAPSSQAGEELTGGASDVDACALRREKDGLWVAFQRACPHAGIDLLAGDLEDLGNGPIVSCPAHAYLFDATTGRCLWDAGRNGPPCTDSLQAYDVLETADGSIWVRKKPKAVQVSAEQWDAAAANDLQMAVVNKVLDRKFPDED
eukprot:TRINITY_DN21527_c0_g1_i1.p1 TRINITY_DN21527_c0_g1~~TRINITY_DN21527_c0_g1_i1.p1  ORF type:complete len:209 (-),score=37.83 TRINITY_DN21527_c0_g1_i1:450-1076(-)